MKRFFGMILMLLMFVGVSQATDTADKVVTQTEFTAHTDMDVSTFVSEWVSDNFSSEVGKDALFPNALEVIILNRPAGEILVTTNIPIDLIFTYNDANIVLTVIEKSEVLTDFSNSVSSKNINTKFAKDLKTWLNKTPQ